MITREDIEKLATLARIKISDEEKESLRVDIENILGYVKSVEGFQASEKINTVGPIHNVMRDDVVTHTTGEYTESLLAVAPARQGNYVKVKKIL